MVNGPTIIFGSILTSILDVSQWIVASTPELIADRSYARKAMVRNFNIHQPVDLDDPDRTGGNLSWGHRIPRYMPKSGSLDVA
jgi:hypothetical protein